MVIYGSSGLSCRGQAYQLLSRAVQEQWNLKPLPEIERTSLGKPYFVGLDTRQFNLSHSGSLALCALDDSPVGVDIQIIKNWRENLPQRVCSEEELTWLKQQSGVWDAFSLLWALKESRVKYTGTGLRERLSSISVPIPRADKTLYFFEDLWFRSYNGEGWMAAACGLTPPPEQIIWLEASGENSPFTTA